MAEQHVSLKRVQVAQPKHLFKQTQLLVTLTQHYSRILNNSNMSFSRINRARPLLVRCMSNIPENSVYGGPKPQNPNQRVTLTHLRQKHKNGEPITMVTAYDYPSAVHLDSAGIDICLVGDSAAMVVHGHDTTLPITLEEMLVHCRAVARGAKRPLLVGDLPFGTYESSTNQVLTISIVCYLFLFSFFFYKNSIYITFYVAFVSNLFDNSNFIIIIKVKLSREFEFLISGSMKI